MIKKLRKKFIITSLLSVFTLLTAILVIINLVNFSLVASDADRILDRMVKEGGMFAENGMPGGEMPNGTQGGMPGEDPGEMQNGTQAPQGGFDPRGPKGLDSPELSQTTRFFTISFDDDGTAVNMMIRMNAVNEEAAVAWAKSLTGKNSGWTKTYYRYRVWKNGDAISVTVIDQSRELLPSYRVLIASCIGEAIGLLLTLVVLVYVAKIVSDPVEKSDRKQKRFIEDAAFELKNPIVAIDALRLTLEKKQGETQETQMIAREIKHLTKVVQGLDTLLLMENASPKAKWKEIDLSQMITETIGLNQSEAQKQEKTIDIDIDKEVSFTGDEPAIERLIGVSLKNAVDYAHSKIEVRLKKQDARIVLEFINDTLGSEDGPLDSVFERFWRSPEVRESGLDGAGLGLSVAKEIVTLHGGRISAEIKDGLFRLKIEL